MGWLCSELKFPIGCLILMWAAGSGGAKVLLHEPTCTTDYDQSFTCQWKMAGPTNCSADLLMSYWQNNDPFENDTCVPENEDGARCVCTMIVETVVCADNYTLRLSARQQLLWEDFFIPCQHGNASSTVKPKPPKNLMVRKNGSDMWRLTWNNPYTPDDYLYSELTYLVNISNANNPSDFKVYNVTYKETFLHLPARSLKSGVSYKARVKARSVEYSSTWSEWSPSNTWNNSYEEPLVQRLPLGVSISCFVILATCLSCYFIVLKIKKEWWDQIPNPAHSPLLAIIIQDSQVSLWGEPSRVQKAAKYPRWKTCLTKLLPCLLEHGGEQDEDPPKTARPVPLHGPAKLASCPVELSKAVLWPESISVVRCVELMEAPVEGEEEEEDARESLCPSLENSGDGFQEGREGIMARLTESLFLDLLGAQGLGESFPSSPSGKGSTERPWVELSSPGPKVPALQGKDVEATSLALMETPIIVADNPAYRSLSAIRSPSPGPGRLDSGSQLASPLGEADSPALCAPQPSEQSTSDQPEPESWEQILHQRVLQDGAAPAATFSPASGYREFVSVVKQGSAQDSPPVSSASGEAGYKAFSSLLPNSTTSPGLSEGEGPGGAGSYKPFRNLLPAFPEASAPVSVPLFTFGLDMEPPQSSLLPSSSPGHLSLEPVVKGEDSQKPPLSSESVTDPLMDDLGSGVVYSTLTCHLCGHLKQCHGQEERGDGYPVASSCCGCCCGDRSSPSVSPLRDFQLQASLSPASPAPLGVSGGSKLSSQPSLSNGQSSGQPLKMVATASSETPCMRVS
ncbi:interleukin-4 receptor subunit alpha [Rhynchocyon petersi]